MANKNKNHSFYKESQKSILGQETWDAKRVGKTIFKILKWLLFAYLIIITLWGCVNEFIIHTSKNLGQGVEFYQEDDFLYPNMYQTKKVVGYQSSEDTNSIEKYKYGEKAKESPKVATPISKIKYANPYYGYDLANVEGVDKIDNTLTALTGDKYFTVTFKNGEATTVNLSPKPGTYNFNWLTFVSSGVINYDAPALMEAGYIPHSVLPYNLRDKDKNINTVADYYNANPSKFTPLGLKDGVDYNINNNGKVTSFNGSFTWNESGPDKFVRNLQAVGKEQLGPDSNKEELTKLNNYNTLQNLVAFSSGTGSIATGNQATLDKISTKYNINSEYKPDYSAILNELTGGAQVYAIPNAKGHPVQLTGESQQLIASYRGDSYNEKTGKFTNDYYNSIDTSAFPNQELLDTDIAFDPESYMYGWAFADSRVNANGQHELLTTFASEEEAIASRDSEAEFDIRTVNKKNAFYANQRRDGWGTETDSINIFDEKAKEAIGKDAYLSMSLSFNSEEEYTFSSKFAGITSATQVQITDSSFRGVLPQYQPFINGEAVYIGGAGKAKDHKKGYYTFEELTSDTNPIANVSWEQRSVLSDSVIPTREDTYGKSRVAFVGWSDWNKAWEIQYGPLYGTIAFPLAQISMGIGEWFGYMNHPWGTLASIALIVFLTRGLAALFSLKGTKNQLKMQEVQTEVAKIKSRYSKYDLKKDKKMKNKQQQEIMALYRKNEVNPMGSLGTIFITMPIFISLWIIISALPAYKLVIMGNFSWAISAWSGVFGGFGALFLVYLMVGIAVGLVQGISSKLPAWLSNKRKGIKRLDDATKEAQKKNNKTQNIMVGVFVFMGLTVPALFAFYWICSGLFTIFLELLRHSWRTHTAKMMKENPSYQTPGVRFSNKMKVSLDKLTK